MTKRKLFSVLFLAGLCSFYFAKKETPHSVTEVHKAAPQPPQSVNITASNGPVRIDIPQRAPASVGYVNTPSPDWEERLQESLEAQGGKDLKDINIKTERSFVWTRDENPLFVQSVVVTLTNQQEAQSSFRAIVDSQTGKILQTWDQTISDPADVRGGFRIKLDPRYTN